MLIVDDRFQSCGKAGRRQAGFLELRADLPLLGRRAGGGADMNIVVRSPLKHFPMTAEVGARFDDIEGVQFGLDVGFGIGSDWKSSRINPRGGTGVFFIARN